MSRVGPEAVREHRPVGGVGTARSSGPPAAGCGSGPRPTTAHGTPRRAAAKTFVNGSPARSRRSSAATAASARQVLPKWLPGMASATASASSSVSTSRSGAATCRRPSLQPPARRGCRRTVPGVDIGTSTRRPRRWGSRRPSTHQPPSSRRAEHGVVVLETRRDGRAAVRRPGPAGCPSRSARPGRARHRPGGRGRGARRGRPPRWETTVQPASAVERSSAPSTASARSPSRARWQLSPEGVRARGHACRAARRRPARRRRPSRRAAPSRVFTRPGDGRLGDHQARARLTTSTRAEVAGGPQRAADRAGHLRPGAGGARVVGDVVLGDPPAGDRGLLQQLDRVAEAAVLARPRASRASRRHTRIGAMSCTGSPIRRRSQSTTSALPARACHGQTPRADRTAAPDGQVGRARSRRRRAAASRSAGSNEPSPSMTAT